MTEVDIIETPCSQHASIPSGSVTWDVANEDKALGYSCEVRVTRGEDSGYIAYIPTLPGVGGQGDDLASTRKDVAESLCAALAAYAEEKMPIPWQEATSKQPEEQSYRIVVNA